MSIVRSDNTATDVLLRVIGGFSEMDKLLERLGVAREAMWMRSTTKETLGKVYPELFSLEDPRTVRQQYLDLAAQRPDLESKFQASTFKPVDPYGDRPEDQCYPHVFTTVLAELFKEGSESKLSALTREVLPKMMSRSLDSGRLRSKLPPFTFAGSKNGTLRGCINDVGFAELPDSLGTIVFAGFVKNSEGQIERGEVEAGEVRCRVLGEMARVAYDYFLFTVS